MMDALQWIVLGIWLPIWVIFVWLWGWAAYEAYLDHRAEMELADAYQKRYVEHLNKIEAARVAEENEANLEESRCLADYYSKITGEVQ